MNSLLRHSAGVAAAFVATASLHAQSLNVTAPGYTSTKLFDSTAGFTITGVATAPNGDVFYIESDGNFTANAHLYRRSASDAYASATPIFDFGAPIFGSFVAIDSGKVYFGESSTGAIRVINPDGSAVDLLGTIAGNYDAAFASGSLYLDYNPGGFSPQGRVSKFDLVADGTGGLMLSAADLIVDTTGDYSGPIEFGPGGTLYYGGSGSFGIPNLFRFSAAEVSSAFGAGPTLTLDGAHQFLANGANAALAFDGKKGLWQTNYAVLDLIDTDTGATTPIASSPDSVSQLDFVDGTVYASVTNFTTNRSSVYSVVPEPSCACLLLIGAIGLRVRRRR